MHSNFQSLVRSGRLLPFSSYDAVVGSFSGGKDSLALALLMVEMGIEPGHLELWHQHVDGAPQHINGRPYTGLMDWPCTASYVTAVCKGLGIPLYNQWREGGIERELYRTNETCQGVWYEDANHNPVYLPPRVAEGTTKRQWPAKSKNLKIRWCSPTAKIDVAGRAICNDDRFTKGNVLFLTGERREESPARNAYDEAVNGKGHCKKRRVDHWRPVIDWTEQEVWDIMKRHKIVPHPAYRIGYGRLSCMHCIYIEEPEWATARHLDPARFQRVLDIENDLGHTIHHKREKGTKKVITLNVLERANMADPFMNSNDPELKRLALNEYPSNLVFSEGAWEKPAGAFRKTKGPE